MIDTPMMNDPKIIACGIVRSNLIMLHLWSGVRLLSENKKGRHVRRPASPFPITLTVIGFPACTVLES